MGNKIETMYNYVYNVCTQLTAIQECLRTSSILYRSAGLIFNKPFISSLAKLREGRKNCAITNYPSLA